MGFGTKNVGASINAMNLETISLLIRASQAESSAHFQAIRDTLERLDNTVHGGTGQAGLVREVEILRVKMDSAKDWQAKRDAEIAAEKLAVANHKRGLGRWLLPIIVSAVSIIGQFVVKLIH